MNIVRKPQGSFEKIFASFSEGLAGLMEISRSAGDALTHQGSDPLSAQVEEDLARCFGQERAADVAAISAAVAALAANAAFDRQYLSKCRLEVRMGDVRYVTTSGLQFGWEVDDGWKFFIRHPDGEDARPESTLRAAALEAGWEELSWRRGRDLVGEIFSSMGTLTSLCREAEEAEVSLPSGEWESFFDNLKLV